MAICLFLILASAGRYLFCQELCRWSHLLTPASHLGSAKGSPHPPNTPSLQYTTAAHAFVLSVRLCREHGFPYPTILLYTSLLIPPLLLLYYFPTKCSSFVPAPLLLSSHTMQRAEHSAQVSPVFSLIVKRCWLTLFQGLGETGGSESVKVIRIYCRTMDLKQCNFQKVMVVKRTLQKALKTQAIPVLTKSYISVASRFLMRLQTRMDGP